MRKSMLVFGQPQIEDDEIQEVLDSLKRAWIGTGPKVNRFEKEFAQYKKVKYTAAVNSCTAALHLACVALNLRPGDEVITTANTFCASVNAIIHSGATPILADIDPITLNISPEDIRNKITDRTKAILLVHFAGRACEMDQILELAKEYGLDIIEDCAHAIETEYQGQKAGTFGRLGCFSFYATKNVVTGEGGMVIGNDKKLIDRIKIMALHGLSADAWSRFSDSGYKHYYVEDIGFKYNMMDLQASIGIHQLNRVEENWKKRYKIWMTYMTEFVDLGNSLPAEFDKNSRHACHLFTIRISKKANGISRDRFLEEMKKRNIGVGVHYLSVPEHPYYRKRFNWNPEDFPSAFQYGRETVSLPLSPKLTQEDVSDVVRAVKDIIS